MEIETHYIQSVSLQDFADKHRLVMEIHERAHCKAGDPARFYAGFKSCEIKQGCMLSREHGNGEFPSNAMEDYASKIQGKILVVNAFSKMRREILVPERLFLDRDKLEGL